MHSFPLCIDTDVVEPKEIAEFDVWIDVSILVLGLARLDRLLIYNDTKVSLIKSPNCERRGWRPLPGLDTSHYGQGDPSSECRRLESAWPLSCGGEWVW